LLTFFAIALGLLFFAWHILFARQAWAQLYALCMVPLILLAPYDFSSLTPDVLAPEVLTPDALSPIAFGLSLFAFLRVWLEDAKMPLAKLLLPLALVVLGVLLNPLLGLPVLALLGNKVPSFALSWASLKPFFPPLLLGCLAWIYTLIRARDALTRILFIVLGGNLAVSLLFLRDMFLLWSHAWLFCATGAALFAFIQELAFRYFRLWGTAFLIFLLTHQIIAWSKLFL
jgi:hypothetical protein